MPFPLQFRPNTTCKTFDGFGVAISTDVPIQLYRPLLNCQFNALPQDFFPISRSGGIIQRFALNDEDTFNALVGPPNWNQDRQPYFTLDEDPNDEQWFISDAIPWTDLTSYAILSGYASKKRANLVDIVDPIELPDGDAAPAVTSPEILWGATYHRVFAHAEDAYYVLRNEPSSNGWWQIVQSTNYASQIQLRYSDGAPGAPILRGNSTTTQLLLMNGSQAPILWVRLTNLDAVNAVEVTMLFTHLLNALRTD